MPDPDRLQLADTPLDGVNLPITRIGQAALAILRRRRGM